MKQAAQYGRGERMLLVAILIAVLVAHALSFFYLSSLASHNPEAPPYPIVAGDSQRYAELADGLLSNGTYGIASDPGSDRHWPPGYTVFLAGIERATGSFTPAVIVQTLLALLAVALVYAMGRNFMSPAFSAGAALLYGLDPMVVFSNTAIVSDGLFASLLIIVIYLAFFRQPVRGIIRWSAIGLLLAAAVMVRAVGEFLVVLIPAAFLLREYLRAPSEREERNLLPAFAAYVLCVSMITPAWIARNYEHFGVYEIAQGGADDLLYYDVQFFLQWKAMGGSLTSVLYPAHHPDTTEFPQVTQAIAQTLANVTPAGGDEDNYTEQAALHYILQDPVRYSYFDVANTLPFFLSGSFGAYEEIVHQERNSTDLSASTLNDALAALKDAKDSGLSAQDVATLVPVVLEVLYWILVCAFALAGLVLEWRRFEIWLFAGLVAYFALLTAALSIARYRIPAEPFLLLLAALGLSAVCSRVRRRFTFRRTSVIL